MAEFSKIEELEKIVKNDPSNFQARRELSMALLDKGFNEDALKHTNYLLGIFPDDARLHYNLGIIFEKLKKNKLAEQAYKKAIMTDNSQADFVYNLAYLYMMTQRYDEALKLFVKVLKMDTKDANVFFNIGFLLSKKKDYEKAIAYLKKAYSMNSADVLALFYIAYAYSRLKDEEQAKIYYNKVLEQCPDYSWAYFNLAVMEYNHKNFDKALELLNETLKYNPKDIEAYKFRAKIFVELNQLERAQTAVELGLQACENDANLYYLLGQINKLQKNIKGYVKNLNLAMQNHITLDFHPKLIKQELNNFIETHKK